MEDKTGAYNQNAAMKNLIIGFLLGVCLMLIIAVANAGPEGAGPYQCCAAGDDSLGVFIVNTHTGQTWRLGRTDIYDFGTPTNPKSVRRSITPYVQ